MQGRAQRRQRPRLRADTFRQAPDIQGLEHQQRQEQLVHQLRGPWTELGQHAGAEGPAGHAQQRRQAVDQRPLAIVAIQQGRTQYAGGHPGGEALQDAGGNQQRYAVGADEQAHGDDFQQQRAEDHRLASQVIRQRTDRQQGCQQAQGIDAEDQGQGRGGKCHRLLVQVVQRRRRTGCREKGQQGDRQEHQAGTA